MPTLFDVVRDFSRMWPDKQAILTQDDGHRTYGELAAHGGAVAHQFQHRFGFGLGDRACIWMRNRPQYIECQLGMQAVGLAGVPTNPEWSDAELEFVLGHSRSRIIFTEAERAERAVALAAAVDSVDAVVSVDEPVDGALLLADLIGEAPEGAGLDLPPVDGFVEGNVLYTSGTTTGRPKAVPMSPELFAGGAIPYEEMFGLSHADRSLVVTPLFHGNAMGGAMSALSRGAGVVMQRKFSVSRFWDLVDLYRPTYFLTLVPIVNILMTLPPSPIERSHSLRVMIPLGCAPIIDQIEERYGVPCMDWYGMTEAGSGTYTRLDEPRRPGSVGKPFEGSVLRIFLPDGSEAPTGEPGEICFLRSSIGFRGYIEDAEATDAAISGDWFRTGDLGYVDDDGYLYFVDRQKDIVRRGGENLSTVEVETALRTHPAVADVAVVARPDQVLGETVAAFVVVADGCDLPTEDELRAHTDGELAPYKLPTTIEAIDKLPRTGTGKVEKFRLRQHFTGA
ncbi:class I adenylate-forming enzyme family protein [Candidatus Poriferisocius sp.]|uniref:class I adenylate-forming enzyme family protein n=1 Tax=Candidatus Poriferisocius sp. TaxID=3101276 RepID=UPI003B59DA50